MFGTSINSVLILAVGALTAFGGHPKVAKDLENLNPEATVDVIIQFKDAPTEKHHQRLRDRGGRHVRDLSMIRSAHYQVPAKVLADLADDANVQSIEPDRPVSGLMGRAQWNMQYNLVNDYLNSIGRAKGNGVGIAFLDSGINAAHINFRRYNTTTSRIVYSQSFIDSDPSDLYGHGTHVAGIAAGMDQADIGQAATQSFWGVAPDASIVSMKVLDANGSGKDSAVIAAIQKVMALKSQYNIRVMNLSLGRPVVSSYKNDPLCQAVEQAWKAGIVVVVAAGNLGRDNSKNNNGYGTITSPGNDPYVITVGAANDRGNWNRASDVIATYSSKGPTAIDYIVKPDLVAPANRVVSYQAPNATLTKQYPSNRPAVTYYIPTGPSTPSPYFFMLSGTSMAAPLVSGLAAVLIARDPTLTPDQVKARLMRTAWRGFPATMSTYDPATSKTYTAYHDLFTVGAGMVDAWAAFNDTAASTGSAASPVAYYDTVARKVKLNLNPTNASTVVWGTTLVWGTSLVWGTNVTPDSSNPAATTVVWGTSLVWGMSTMQGFSVVWGTGGMSGSNSLTGEAAAIAIQGEN